MTIETKLRYTFYGVCFLIGVIFGKEIIDFLVQQIYPFLVQQWGNVI